jgi:hypothetical protein
MDRTSCYAVRSAGLATTEEMAKHWMMDGAKEETEEAAVKGAIAGSVTGTLGLLTEGTEGREVEAPRPAYTL